jgi:hypothetical protein
VDRAWIEHCRSLSDDLKASATRTTSLKSKIESVFHRYGTIYAIDQDFYLPKTDGPGGLLSSAEPSASTDSEFGVGLQEYGFIRAIDIDLCPPITGGQGRVVP